MISYFVHDGTYLLRKGMAPESQVQHQAREGETVEQGEPEGFDALPPHAGARWNIGTKQWDDCRTEREKTDTAAFDVLAARHAAYPPLHDLADALVHEALGNPGPMDTYLTACIAVKARFPKVK